MNLKNNFVIEKIILRLKKYFETEEKFKTAKQTLWHHFSSIAYTFINVCHL